MVLLVIVWQSAEHLDPGEAGLTPRTSAAVADGVLGPWLHWDAGAFHDIAENGYRTEDRAVYDAGGQARVAYFPGYPLLVRAGSVITRDISLGLIVVTFVSGLGAVVVFDRWLRNRMGASPRVSALWCLLLFPWAYFLVATGYSDALFLLAALGAFVLMERDKPLAAMVAGFVATLTRPVGAAVTVGLIIIAVERRQVRQGDGAASTHDRASVGAHEVGALASIGGLLCFMAFCWSRYGTPLAFSIAQRGWNQAAGPRTWLKIPLFEFIRDGTDDWLAWRLVLQGLVALVFAAAIPAVWRRFGTAYGTYTAIVVLVPLIGASAFASLGRYMLAAFPVFALLGEHLDRWSPPRRLGYLLASGAGLLVTASFWGRGYWMG